MGLRARESGADARTTDALVARAEHAGNEAFSDMPRRPPGPLPDGWQAGAGRAARAQCAERADGAQRESALHAHPARRQGFGQWTR